VTRSFLQGSRVVIAATSRRTGDSDVSPRYAHPGGFGSAAYHAVDTGELTEEEAFLIVRGFLTAGL
jgi:hypothetical protein